MTQEQIQAQVWKVPEKYDVTFVSNFTLPKKIKDSADSLVVWSTDNEEPTALLFARVFRTSLRKSKQKRNEFVLPSRLAYDFSRDFKWDTRECLAGNFTEKPLIGFCGNAARPFRKRCLRVFRKAGKIQTMFVTRDHFVKKAPSLSEYQNDNLRVTGTCPYILCPRGRGNWSVRLYETMAAGRIPVIPDTDILLPHPHLIPWREIVIKGKLRALPRLLLEFHAKGEDHTKRTQKKAFDCWYRYLRPSVFFDFI